MNATLTDLKSMLTEKLDILIDQATNTRGDVSQIRQVNATFYTDLGVFLEGVATPGGDAWKVLGI